MAERSATKPTYDEFAAVSLTRMLRTAYLLTGDVHDAHDLCQDVLERLFVSWWRVKDDPYAYANRMLVNMGHNRFRWRRRHPETRLEAAGDPPQGGDPAVAVADRDALVRALQQLPSRQRAVLVLRYFQDLSEVETANA